MVHFGGLGQSTLGPTLLAEGMGPKVPSTELWPAVVVATIDPLGTLVAIVVGTDLLGMFLAVGVVG